MAANGKFIVIEGLEGAGKSTAVHTVIELLTQLNINTLATREPGGTAIGEIVRDLFKNIKYRNILDERSELLLLYAARIQLVEEVIKPALSQGIWVIADRFELSTLAYQGGGRQLHQEIINQLSSFALKGFKPDLTVYLDISPEAGMQRVKSRGQSDRIEQESIDFFNRVHASYLYHIRNTSDQVIMIDASLEPQKVQQEICSAMNKFIEQLP